MAEIFTWATLRTKIKDEMDLDEETFVNDTELLNYANEAIDEAEAEIHNINEGYFRRQVAPVFVASTKRYVLNTFAPNIFANKIVDFFYDNGTSKQYRIERLRSPRESITLDLPGNTSSNYRYDIENTDAATGTELVIYPTPTSAETGNLKLWYIRQANRIAADTDLVDIPDFRNFIEDYIKQKVAEKEIHPLLQNFLRKTEASRRLMLKSLSQMIPDEEETIDPDLSFYADFDDHVYGPRY